MRKTIISLALVALSGLSLKAYADQSLIFLSPDEEQVSATALAEISKITFGATSLNIVTENDAVEVPYESIGSIRFGEATGITTLTPGKQGLTVTYTDNCLRLSGRDGAVDVDIFAINGTRVGYARGYDSDVISVERLAPGTYIAKIASAVVKFVK